MKYCRLFFLLSVAFISNAVWAQSQKALGRLMRNRGEYYFTIDVSAPSEIQAISNICSVDGTDGHTVVCYANQQEYDKLLRLGYRPALQTPPSLRVDATMWDGQGTYNWDCYLTYPQYVAMMEGFPNSVVSDRTCTLIDLGTLPSSHKIFGVRINNGQPDGKPKFLYSSTIHGDETTGWIMMLRLIDELCTSTDSRIVNLVDSLDIYIFPNTNPDGTYFGGDSTVTGSRRYNNNDVDLNRHFKDFVNGDHPDGASSYELEAQWMMDLGLANLFTMAANYHGGDELMNYPFDCTMTLPADASWWEYVCSEYVSLARQVYPSYMSHTFPSGVTNGALWYMIGGGRQDFMNYYAQCREVTIECSVTKTLEASQLPSYWNYNHNSMLSYMEQCLNGVHGFVYDAETGQPLQGVTVTVQDHDALDSEVSTHANGDFHRPIKGGSYTFAFEKEGYCPQFVEVTVADGQRVELNDIQLTSDYCLAPKFSVSSMEVNLGSSLSFTDASYGAIVSWDWTFEGGTPSTSTDQNPSNIVYNMAGTFDVTLTITDTVGNSETLTKQNYIHVTESHNMSNATVTTCDALFYDSGGPNSNYGNKLTQTMTFYPASEGAKVSVAFSEFNTELECDFLFIYNGASTSATQIGKYSGTMSPGTVTATNASGALTFKFTSDRYTTRPGWAATVSCVYPIVEQTVALVAGWNWWAPIVETTLADLETALGVNGLRIDSETSEYASYENGSWSGSLTSIVPGQMYKIQTLADDNFSLSGRYAPVIVYIAPGYNWFGYTGAQVQTVVEALNGFTPAEGDKIDSQNEGFAIYENGAWGGSLTTLYPGHGYVYISNATGSKTLVFQ